MSAAGAFCLVLHGHLPWVLHHGRWPHGEDWLYEAAAGTWMPLLEVLEVCRAEGIRPSWTIGMMPILLEQLRHARFEEGFVAWLGEYEERAARDGMAFEAEGRADLAELAEQHQRRFRALLNQFEELERDIPGALVAAAEEGLVELLSSNATHAYHPLVLHDASARAQVRAGLATSERHFGWRPRGVWLPECAYRPAGAWRPPVVHGDARDREGVATLYANEGVRYFVVDAHLAAGSEPFAVLGGERVERVPPSQGEWDAHRAWRSPNEPLRVVERGQVTELTVLARSPEVSEQVWSGKIGYPGDPTYLEFHKRHGMRGLRYWRVTGRDVELQDKEVYRPDEVDATLHRQAVHFVETVRRKLANHRAGTGGRYGVVCAPFDAELFGHWWTEGPRWLLEVARRLHHEDQVDTLTVSEFLDRVPPDKAVRLPEGSWGAGGDHRVWLNDELTFFWEIAYRAEDRFLHLWHMSGWRTHEAVAELLEEAGRQLLLLLASDWPFVISTRGAVDYGLRRILDHAARFDDLCNGVEDILAGRPEDPVVIDTLERCRIADPVFPDLDLEWWA